MSQAELTRLTNTEPESSWKSLYKIGGVTALIALIVAPAEVAIGLLPGVDHALTNTVTAVDWFTLFQNHWFLGLRSFGLLNIVGAVLLVPSILAIYSVLKRENEAYGTFGAILFFVGVAVYFANNRAFSMLSLSSQYASAATDVQRSLLAAAGQTMLAEGQSRAGILLIEFACAVISAVMLKGGVFSKTTAYAGILGNSLMMILEIAFMPPRGVGMVIAAGGGLSTMTWYVLIGRRLLQLGCLAERT